MFCQMERNIFKRPINPCWVIWKWTHSKQGPYTGTTTQVYRDFPDSHRLVLSTKHSPLSSWKSFTILGISGRHLFFPTEIQPRLKIPSQQICLGNKKHDLERSNYSSRWRETCLRGFPFLICKKQQPDPTTCCQLPLAGCIIITLTQTAMIQW